MEVTEDATLPLFLMYPLFGGGEFQHITQFNENSIYVRAQSCSHTCTLFG